MSRGRNGSWVNTLWVHATAEAALVLSAPRIPPEMEVPGFIAAPAVRSRVTGTVAIVLAEGVILHDATVDYWPADDLGAVQVLATGVEADGGDTVATLDTTLLANGSYVVRVSGTDGAGTLRASGTMVTVEGEYKPGRVRFTVNDLTAPVVGLPIVIGRTYDSLERHEMGDFGYGWSLAIGNPRLEVDPDHNVTLTMPDGRRVTFYFSPQIIWGFGIPTYLPEAGVYGSLKAQACGLVVSSGGKWFCFPGGPYQESVGGYVYTDPYGREFTMGVDGRLQSIKDLNNNVLTFSADGITSSAGGLQVTFTRDAQGRITGVTDPLGNVYSYTYRIAGDLVSVRLPGVEEPVRYTYNYDHLFLSVEDPRGNTLATATYYPDGRLASETDALGNTTRYEYDGRGNLVRITDGADITMFTWDARDRLVGVTLPDGTDITYAYDADGRRVQQAVGKEVTNYLWDETSPYGDVVRYVAAQGGGEYFSAQDTPGLVAALQRALGESICDASGVFAAAPP